MRVYLSKDVNEILIKYIKTYTENIAFVENNGYQYFLRSNVNANAFIIKYKNGIMDKQDIEFNKL